MSDFDNRYTTSLNAPQTLRDLLSFVQHQMRTKIGIILGSVDIVKITEREWSVESHEDLDRIRRAANDMLTLIDQWLMQDQDEAT